MSKLKSGSYRTTISIPQDLKRRMDKAGPDVNWSAIAAAAFEAKLAEIAAKKVKKNMDDVIQRLRASNQENEAQSYKEGFKAGQEWAKDYAEAADLKKLSKFREPLSSHEWELQFVNDDYNPPVSDRFIKIVWPDADEDAEFWAGAIGEDFVYQADDGEFVHGFADGALNVWDEVKARL